MDAGRGDAGPPPIAAIRVAGLPTLPAAAFAVPRRTLLLVSGCLGGRGVTDPSQQSVCGEGYRPDRPTLRELAVELPRPASSDTVSLSVLGGTPAVATFDLSLGPGTPGDPLAVATDVVPGALRPGRPTTEFSSAEIGAAVDAARVRVHPYHDTRAAYDEPWAATFAASGVSALVDGRAYVLVLVGPYPGFDARRWWNDPLVTLVPTDAE